MGTGLILVTTGDEAMHSIPVMGQVFRAVGRNLKVCVIDFGPGAWSSWVRSSFPASTIEIHQQGSYMRPLAKNPRESWEKAKELINSGGFDMVVIEGLSLILAKRIVESGEVADFLLARPKGLHVILTDTQLNGPVLGIVDMVTEIRNVKHPTDSTA